MLNKIINNITNHNITLLAGQVQSGKPQLISKILYHYAIKHHQKTILFSNTADDTYYTSYLISTMTNLPRKTITNFLHPCSTKENHLPNLDSTKFISSIHQLQQSNLTIKTNTYLASDELDYILKLTTDTYPNLLIIDNLDTLISSSKYNLETILTKLQSISKTTNTHIVLLSTIPLNTRSIQLKNIPNFTHFKNRIPNIILLERNYVHQKHDLLKITNYTNQTISHQTTINYQNINNNN